MLSVMVSASAKFQSTLPHGERPLVAVIIHIASVFQSTLPHGERRIGQVEGDFGSEFQSTLPHGERLTINASRSASAKNRVKVNLSV